MLLKIRVLNQKIKSFKMLLHILLTFKKPTDNLVVFCSQQLDEYIVQYQKLSPHNKKGA